MLNKSSDQRSIYYSGSRACGRGRGRSRVQCQLRGKVGHLVDRCWHRYDQDFSCVTFVNRGQYQSEYKTTSSLGNFTVSSTDGGCECCAKRRTGSVLNDQPQAHAAFMQYERWVVDTGATHHVTADANKVLNSSEYLGPGKLLIGNGMPLDVALVGHSHNGVVERKHRHIVELALVLLDQASLPIKYWYMQLSLQKRNDGALFFLHYLNVFNHSGKECRPRQQLLVYAKRVSGLEEALRIRRERELQGTPKFRRPPPLRRGKVSPRLPVPDHIPKPPYLDSNILHEISSEHQIHDAEGIARMRAARELAACVLNYAGTLVRGYHGDTSRTFLCGDVSGPVKRLVQVTEECLEKGIAVCKDGASFKKIGKRISEHAEKYGYGVVERFVGHSVGTFFILSQLYIIISINRMKVT
ncbi:uncharacterized protein LOC120181160 [Hibiscus syriacus]|uniref:uncharacterized protein LOC120181160 n=1 Tax=Hibiscus syriacus TaxID=106335 RepID=UPI0019220409|nr:uncharacterized protein LOC120181160 [Hibiscus syriacus]